jgi:hypothetical protein
MNANIIEEIRQRANKFVADNYREGTDTDRVIIRTAMLIGASIALQKQMEGQSEIEKAFAKESGEGNIPDEVWHA